MLYGPSGAGKTHLALELANKITAPDKSILHVDTADNYVIREQVPNWTIGFAPLRFTTIEDLRLIAEAIATGYGPYGSIGTVILDEASSMAADDLDRVYESRKAAGKTDSDVPEWGDFRPALHRFRTLLSSLMDVPGLNIVLVAHEREDKTKAVKPDFSPATAKKVKERLHVVARITATNEVRPGEDEATYSRIAQIHPTKLVDAKSRLGVPTVKFDASFLADGIKDWLDAGAEEHQPVNVPAPEPNPIDTTVKEAFDVVDDTPNFDTSDLDDNPFSSED